MTTTENNNRKLFIHIITIAIWVLPLVLGGLWLMFAENNPVIGAMLTLTGMLNYGALRD
jgi:hypothetical protein